MAATDLLTLAEGYRAINDVRNASKAATAQTGSHDDTIGLWISGISERIDELCGPVVQRTVVEHLSGGSEVVILDTTHVASVTSVTEYSGASATLLTQDVLGAPASAGFTLEDLAGTAAVYRTSGGSGYLFPHGRGNVVVTVVAGRYVDTEAVGAKFKLAAGAILRRLWQREGAAWATGGAPFEQGIGATGFFRAVNPMVAEFLGHELLGPVFA